MTPLELLARVVPSLNGLSGEYALAGGLAASFYRERPRLTNDIDVALVAGTDEQTRTAAEALLVANGLEPALGWISGSAEVLSTPVAVVIGRLSEDKFDPSLDLLLPVFPWVRPAVRRAQDNCLDLGFAVLPTLLPEDIIVAKAFALSLEPNRFQDLDDIQAIIRGVEDLDLVLLTTELERLNLTLPPVLRPALPPALLRVVGTRRRGG